ncbi:hypothetical protein SAMN05421797_104184 [Maribacter ulvicola]|uniref:Uncharacterized protein n=1 Tax=Maribacter ulvicola TaxID=228959 RepID=A0A1N6WQJ5_9FLAO|nr:hypothetical protein SAMN05421797_104184 [Maribacter ulvicola]
MSASNSIKNIESKLDFVIIGVLFFGVIASVLLTINLIN